MKNLVSRFNNIEEISENNQKFEKRLAHRRKEREISDRRNVAREEKRSRVSFC